MRLFGLFGLVLLLSGCSGAWDFFGDTHSLTWNPNQPIGDSENIRRVRGLSPQLPPIGPEPGNVWPGPVPPEPTLRDLERSNQPLGGPPGAVPPGTASPSGVAAPGGQTPAAPGAGTVVPPPTRQPRPPAGASATPPAAPAPRPGAGTGKSGVTPANGSIVVPNGNGTSTVIGPDGSITTIPTPK